jgi:membrane-bound lytic murein transglycosylase D
MEETDVALSGMASREPFYPDMSWLPPKESASVRKYMLALSREPQTSGVFTRRAKALLPVVIQALAERGLPLELAFLPVVESRFEPQALSTAGAAGIWQLMPHTARRFGLVVTRHEDERFDVRKATAAAASYLASLHRRFQDWPLAVAAYNCGEGALIRALERTGATTLTELMEACSRNGGHAGLLAKETLDFVPKFVGAVWAMTTMRATEDGALFRECFPVGTVFFRDPRHWPGVGMSPAGRAAARRVAMVP